MSLKIAILSGLFLVGFFAGWTVNGWRLGNEVTYLESQYKSIQVTNERMFRALQGRDKLLSEQSENIKSLYLKAEAAKERMDKLSTRLSEERKAYDELMHKWINRPLPSTCDEAVREAVERLRQLVEESK